MNIERYFDVIYTAISVAFLAALAVDVVRGILLGRRAHPYPDRARGRGSALAAFGTRWMLRAASGERSNFRRALPGALRSRDPVVI